MLTPRMTPNQIRVDAEMLGGGTEQRDDDEGELEEVEEEGEHEHEGVDENQEAELSAGQRRQHVLHPDMPAHAVERERKHARADQYENHEGRQLGRRFDGLADQVPGQPALDGAEDQRAAGAHGAAFGRRGDADEDGAEHQEDQASGGTITKMVCCARFEMKSEAVVLDQCRDQRIGAAREKRDRNGPFS